MIYIGGGANNWGLVFGILRYAKNEDRRDVLGKIYKSKQNLDLRMLTGSKKRQCIRYFLASSNENSEKLNRK